MEEGTGPSGRTSGGKVTVSELAAHTGLSRSTVSLVLRNSPLVADDTRRKVLSAIEALGYVYDRGAARMRGKHSQTIGVIVVDLTSSFYAEFLAGVDAALDPTGRLAFVANSGEDPARQARLVERYREHAVDGIILCPAEGADASLVGRIAGRGLPCVQALRVIDGTATDFAGTDNRRGTALATEHLVGLGHRHVAFVGSGALTSVARDRTGGYVDTMRRHGLEPVVVDCANAREAGSAAVAGLLRSGRIPTGIVCFNDPVAMGVMQGLQRAGLRPGRDVSVVGFDDIADASLWVPSLTTVAIRPFEIGRSAAELLTRRIAAPDRAVERRIVEPELVLRDSSGALERTASLSGSAA